VRAIALEDPMSGPLLQELPVPEPKATEILVSVRASSVNTVDRAIATGGLLASVEHGFPVVLGHDFAGLVDRVGRDTTLFAEGDEAFGFITRSRRDAVSGTWADYIVVPENRFVARKLATLGFVQSGEFPNRLLGPAQTGCRLRYGETPWRSVSATISTRLFAPSLARMWEM
jgi:NADPH:quinone reductase-like Zn-dependent oxidoreductase